LLNNENASLQKITIALQRCLENQDLEILTCRLCPWGLNAKMNVVLKIGVSGFELGITTYNGIKGGETKQKDGAHDHGNKHCSIVTSNGDGTLARCNGGGEGH